jgi:hypothetical protein
MECIYDSHFQMANLKHIEVKWLVQGYTVNKWQVQYFYCSIGLLWRLNTMTYGKNKYSVNTKNGHYRFNKLRI